MDCLFCCCSVYDSRISLFPRPASLVSHLPSISVHSIALTTTDFPFAFVRNPRAVLISSKFSWRISCEAIPTKQSHSNPKTEERIKRHSAMKHFFIEECHFSSSETNVLISKDPSLFRTKSINNARQVLQMLKDYRFTVEQVRKTIFKNPIILTYSVVNLKPKIEYLKTLGMAQEDVNHIVSIHPRLVGNSLHRTIVPRFLFLTKLFGSKAHLFKALRRAPGIAFCDVEQANSKMKVLENAGLLEHEIKRILEVNPRFLCDSVGKIEKNMKFLTCTLGLKPNVVVKYPVLINLSVERRMTPRYKVFQYLNSSEVRDDLTLPKSLVMTEEIFAQRVLSGSPEVKMLYEKFKGKTADVEVPEIYQLTRDDLE